SARSAATPLVSSRSAANTGRGAPRTSTARSHHCPPLAGDDLAAATVVDHMSEQHVGPLAKRRLAVAADLVVAGDVAREHAGAEEHAHEHGDADVDPLLVTARHAAATARRSSSGRRNCPVYASATPATSSGVPTAITSPPASPPSGPRSTIQSA